MDRLIVLIVFCSTSGVVTGRPVNDNLSKNVTFSSPQIVVVKSHINLKFFDVPTSDEPVLTWIEVQNGIFPYTQVLKTNMVDVGDPLTVYVYIRDKSNMYDVKVNQCWAADSKNISNAKNKFLISGRQYRKIKDIGEWQKYTLPEGEEIKSFLYTSFKAFKFPENENIYINCDVELCYKTCKTGYKLSNLLR